MELLKMRVKASKTVPDINDLSLKKRKGLWNDFGD